MELAVPHAACGTLHHVALSLGPGLFDRIAEARS